MTFYDEKSNSYRDIELKIYIKPENEDKDRLTQKKLSEFVANLIQLREELTAGSGTKFVNKLQVLAIPQRPDHSSIIMGHLPTFGITNNSLPAGLVVDADSETKLLKCLTVLLEANDSALNKNALEKDEFQKTKILLANFILDNQPKPKLKQIKDEILSRQDEAIILLLRQINDNCNFLAYDSKFDYELEIICKEIRNLINTYGNLEVFDDNTSVEYHESELDTDTE